jgi:RNA methyltransferase, TrmH family
MRATPAAGIQSLQNPRVKEIRKAVRRGTATESGLLVAEGLHLYEEALRSGLRVAAVFAVEDFASRVEGACLVPEALMREMSSLDTPAGLIALVETPEEREVSAGVTVVLDAVQDPGNAGTILRTAEAFGVGCVVALKGSVDLFAPKVVRASSGSVFRVPVRRHLRWGDVGVNGRPVFVSTVRGGVDPKGIDWSVGAVLVIGNEGRGVSEDLVGMGTAVSIPTRGVESLNAAVAASILIYEAIR